MPGARAARGPTDADLVDSATRARGKRVSWHSCCAFLRRGAEPGAGFRARHRKRLDALREAAGPGTDFVLDGAGSLVPGDAASLATAFERFHLLWLDEPCELPTSERLKKIASENVTPLGSGASSSSPRLPGPVTGRRHRHSAARHLTERDLANSPDGGDRGAVLHRCRAVSQRRSGRLGGGAAARRQPAELLHPANPAAGSGTGPDRCARPWPVLSKR